MTTNPANIKTICVYCGSADHLHPAYLESAAQLGRSLADRRVRLVYGAGKTGLMGAVADGALSQGGWVTGVVCDNLNTPQLIHSGLSELEVVPDIQQRKARMSALADAFIALPGGFGTMDELFETLTWAQIGLHAKPVGLLNTRGYYDLLMQWIEHSLQEGFILPEHAQLFVRAGQPEDLLERLLNFETPPGLERWVNR
jgi:uncharacterized protein (TIGR00730 family)